MSLNLEKSEDKVANLPNVSNLEINEVEINGHVELQDDENVIRYHNGIYWRLLFLNLVVLWAYQSLISAQNYYLEYFPNDHLDFWGTLSAGTSMFIIHILQLYFQFYKFGFTKRVIPGFIGYILIAILVMSIKNQILLIISFGSVGALNTFTESPIYGIAGLFSTGSFTQAVQVGNGLAGFLNVSCNTIIRLIVLFIHSNLNNDQLAFYLFMSLLIFLSLLAMFVYYQLIHLPPVQIRLEHQMASFNKQIRADVVQLELVSNEMSFWKLGKILKVHLFVQFYVLFISLLLWPGIPCSVRNNGWFNYQGKSWWCSPFIIGTFNFGDLIGRTIAVKLQKYFSQNICLISALLRTFFILIIFYRNNINNILVLCLITLMGMSNGLIATVTFMVRPKTILGVNNCERAAYLMTAALYLGIAAGSIFAATLEFTHLI